MMKRKGARIRGVYRVLQAFPFVQGVLYYTEVDPPQASEGTSPRPTRFLHGLDLHQVGRSADLRSLLKRDSYAFFPLQGLFVEEDVLYQLFGKMNGILLAYHLFRSVPLSMDEAIHILRRASGQLVRIHEKGQFTVVHPQNMLLTADSVRFLYGGPSGLLPKLRGESAAGAEETSLDRRLEKEQMMDVYSLGALAYIMLTGTSPAPGKQTKPIRAFRSDTPAELEHLVMQSLLADPRSRPRLEDLWRSLNRVSVKGETDRSHQAQSTS